jgi:hypothetical protein
MKNQLIIRSEAARAELQRSTGLDDLSYHLMVLEAGCACLDQTLRPVNASVGAEAVQAYRTHLYAQGWWTWFELFWRQFEIRLWAEWSGPESIVPLQSDDWRRESLHKEASTLYYTDYYHHAFDHFLKMLEERGQLAIPMPKGQHEPQCQQQAL